ncbi:MAG: hypothetical protein KDM81_07095, partial [Verrucomicrobiae bacterium]|nr:hypothetical protein [Verrucomicrobiae bacterium]
LEEYVKDLVGTYGSDRRVIVWDLYNEPGNGTASGSRELMEAAFGWAREMEPAQPLTTGAWTDFQSTLSRRMMELSDVVSFHGYDPVPGIEAKLEICAAQGRPVLCTEWLVRRDGNTFEQLLPLFRNRRIGCYNWGLVAGRTQTYFPWGSPQGAAEPERWQHDILRADGTPFSTREVRFIKGITGNGKRVTTVPILTTEELPGLERPVLAVEPNVLNPVLEPGVSGRLTLTGVFADDSSARPGSFTPPSACTSTWWMRTSKAPFGTSLLRRTAWPGMPTGTCCRRAFR